ncbi:MAG: papain-like cysteine protease family protein, partial [Candidatus Shapirobacteria bacterium]|nr:papain-like cysteine protease family protein [Candidatus Shapirobacteria bacterium]
IRNQQYLKVAQKHDKMLMIAIEEAKQDFDRQKSLKEEKQAALEGLRVQLKEQNVALDLQKREKEHLLEVTKNDEVRYQQLLAQAQKELASLLSFTRTRVGSAGSICAGEFSSGDTGWFFSQRDSRWCNSLIGHSNMTIGQVGCLINSVAMVNKSRGANITPLGIANSSSFFFLNTAYMLWPFPSFVDQRFVEISKTTIDEELAKKNPVIVHLGLGGDGHWIVLVKKDGDDYIINDPWYGPDKKLTDYYNWGLVGRPYVLR